MPEEMERELRAQVEREHPDWPQERKDAYVYDTMRKRGWRPEREKQRRYGLGGKR